MADPKTKSQGDGSSLYYGRAGPPYAGAKAAPANGRPWGDGEERRQCGPSQPWPLRQTKTSNAPGRYAPENFTGTLPD